MTSTFEVYAARLESHQVVDQGALDEASFVATIRDIDDAVAEVDGSGFHPTPFGPQPGLADAAGLDGVELWVKDETGNVSGSHKARHLFGVALAHQLRQQTGDGDTGSPTGSGDQPRAPFAIASCGNAALAAAVVARAVNWPLDVFVPDWANDAVVARISELGGRVVRCERAPGVTGDPAHHAFVAAIAAGAVPFSCQGTETAGTIDGGRTLAYEMIETLGAHPLDDARAGGRGGSASGEPGQARLDRVVVQVGGGALASAVLTGLAHEVAHRNLARLPVVHVVQPEGNHPLVRAWDRLMAELGGDEPASNEQRKQAASALGAVAEGERRALMARLTADPGRYMEPWPEPPESYATGILDDITYDWLPIVDALVASGGYPVVASEADLRRAHRLARTHTEIPVCPTGASGLAGLLTVGGLEGDLLAGERIAVLFTGSLRPGDPDPRSPSEAVADTRDATR